MLHLKFALSDEARDTIDDINDLMGLMTYCELSNNRDIIDERMGRSDMTAVVMTAFGLSDACCIGFRLPPGDGFKPNIHTRCCRTGQDRMLEKLDKT